MDSRSSARHGFGDPHSTAAKLPHALPATMLKLLEGAVRALGTRGRDISLESVCQVSGVSRATLYRYFANKDDLLDAVGEFICRQFEIGLADEASRHERPEARFAAIMAFLLEYTENRGLIRIFEVDPSFHLVFFRSHFARHVAAVAMALAPVFDWIEARDGRVIEPQGSAERLVRLQLSRLLVPFDAGWMSMWRAASDQPLQLAGSWMIDAVPTDAAGC
jgi:AcrR family transcriptional regulator